MKIFYSILLFVFFISFNQAFASVENRQNNIELVSVSNRNIQPELLQRKAEEIVQNTICTQSILANTTKKRNIRWVDHTKAREISREQIRALRHK